MNRWCGSDISRAFTYKDVRQTNMRPSPVVPRKPTLEFDGEMRTHAEKVVPCAVQIWYAANAYDPMTIRVIAPDIEDHVTLPTEISTGFGLYCNASCEIKLQGVWLREWTSHSLPVRRQLNHEIQLAHVSRLVLSSTVPIGRIDVIEGATECQAPLAIKLSESAYLSPVLHPNPDAKGMLAFEQLHPLETEHPVLGVVKFERRFRFTPSGTQDVHVSSELVAVVSRPLIAETVDAKATAELFEDLCLLASVAGRHRVEIRGWWTNASEYFEEAFTNPLEYGAGLQKVDKDDVLIDRHDTSHFLKHCIETWNTFNCDELRKLRYACYALAPRNEVSIEASFLAMFPALEGLVSIFVARHGGGLVYSKPKAWKEIRSLLKSAIDSIDVDDPHFNPAAMKQNLSALERVPLSQLTRSVLSDLGAWTDQLWPLFEANGTALANVRNLLAHGEQIDPHKMGAVVVARDHLRRILERTLCRALDWPLDDTAVGNAALRSQDRVFAAELSAARAVLAGTEPGPMKAKMLPKQSP